MPDDIARKRLKKRMLERWENEGGRISTEPTTADKGGPAKDQLSKGKQRSASSDNSTGSTPASPAKRPKRTRK